MEEHKEDIFPIDKEDADLASFTSRLRRRTPNGGNRHKSRPISYPPCFAYDLQKPTFLKGRLMDRKPQKLIDPIPKEIALKAGRKVKFADEAGKQLVSYLEIPNKFDRLGFRSLTNISSTFEKVIGDNFDDVFESTDDVFDDIFNSSFERPIFSLDDENNERTNSPGQKRKYGVKGQTFPKEHFPKESLFSEQRQLSDSTSRKKQLSELSSPHVKLRKYSLEEWIITESDEESTCDRKQKSTTFYKTEFEKDKSQNFHLRSEKSHNNVNANKKSLASYQDVEYNLPRKKSENDWVNIPVLVFDKEKENYNPKDVVLNSHNLIKENIRNSKPSMHVADDDTELKYQKLCKRLCPAGQDDHKNIDIVLSKKEDILSEKHLSFTSDESVEEVNFTLVIDQCNKRLDAHANNNNKIDMDNNIEVSYTYCPNISAIEVPADKDNVMTSSFDENPNIAFTILALKDTENGNRAEPDSTPHTEESCIDSSDEKNKDNTLTADNHDDTADENHNDSNDFVKDTESALKDILDIFDSITFPEENKETQILNYTSNSLEESQDDESENSLVLNDVSDKNMDTDNSVDVFSVNCYDNSDSGTAKSDNTTPCIQVFNDSDTDCNQNDFISGIEVNTSKSDHKITLQDKTKPNQNLLYVCEDKDETNDDLVSMYHDSESGYVTYSHQDSLETIRNFDFDDDEERSDNNCSGYESSSIETDIDSRNSHSRTANVTKSNCNDNTTSTSDSESINKVTYSKQELSESNKKCSLLPAEKNNASSTDDSCSDSCTKREGSTTDKILEPNCNIKTWTFDGTETNDFHFNHEASNSNVDGSDSSASNSKNNEEGSCDESSFNSSNRQNNDTFNRDVSYVSSLSGKTNSVENITKCEGKSLENYVNVDQYCSDNNIMSQTTVPITFCESNLGEINALTISTTENQSYHCENSTPNNNTSTPNLNNIDVENNPILECSSQISQSCDERLSDKKYTYQEECHLPIYKEICNPFTIGNSNDLQLHFSFSSDESSQSKRSNQNKNPDKQIERSNYSEKIPYIHATVCSNDIENINIKMDNEGKNSGEEGTNDQQSNKNETPMKENMTFENKHNQILRTLHGISAGGLSNTDTNVKPLPYSNPETPQRKDITEGHNSSKISNNVQSRNDTDNKRNGKNRYKHKLMISTTFSSSDSEHSDASVQYKKHKRTKRVKKNRLLSKDKQRLAASNECSNKLQLSESILEEDPGNESDVESILNESSTANSLTSSSSSIQEDLCLCQEPNNHIEVIPINITIPEAPACAIHEDTANCCTELSNVIEKDIITTVQSKLQKDKSLVYTVSFNTDTTDTQSSNTSAINEDTVKSTTGSSKVIQEDITTSDPNVIQEKIPRDKCSAYTVSFNTDTTDTQSSNSDHTYERSCNALSQLEGMKENSVLHSHIDSKGYGESNQSDLNCQNTSHCCNSQNGTPGTKEERSVKTFESDPNENSILDISKEDNISYNSDNEYVSNTPEREEIYDNNSSNVNISDKSNNLETIYNNGIVSTKQDILQQCDNSGDLACKETSNGGTSYTRNINEPLELSQNSGINCDRLGNRQISDLVDSVNENSESNDCIKHDTCYKNTTGNTSDYSDNSIISSIKGEDKFDKLESEVTKISDNSGCYNSEMLGSVEKFGNLDIHNSDTLHVRAKESNCNKKEQDDADYQKKDNLYSFHHDCIKSNDETEKCNKPSIDSKINDMSFNYDSFAASTDENENCDNLDTTLTNYCAVDSNHNHETVHNKHSSQNDDKTDITSSDNCDLMKDNNKDNTVENQTSCNTSHNCECNNGSCLSSYNEFTSHGKEYDLSGKHKDSDDSDECYSKSGECKSKLKCHKSKSENKSNELCHIKECENTVSESSDSPESSYCNGVNSISFVKEHNGSDSTNNEVSDEHEIDNIVSRNHSKTSVEQDIDSVESDSQNNEVSVDSVESDSHKREVSVEHEIYSVNSEVSVEHEIDSVESDSHKRVVSVEHEIDSVESDSHKSEVSVEHKIDINESHSHESSSNNLDSETTSNKVPNHNCSDDSSSDSDENSETSSDISDDRDHDAQPQEDHLSYNQIATPEQCKQIAQKLKSDKRELVKSLSLSNSSGSELEIISKCGGVNKIDDVNVTVTITCDGQLIVNDDTCGVYRN